MTHCYAYMVIYHTPVDTINHEICETGDGSTKNLPMQDLLCAQGNISRSAILLLICVITFWITIDTELTIDRHNTNIV